LAAELGELSMLIKQLAESVASHEMKLLGASNFAPVGKPGDEPQPLADTATPEPAGFAQTTNVASAADEIDAAKAPVVEQRQNDMIEVVRAAIEANRVELYLQPIVTLPQRKVRYYEAFTGCGRRMIHCCNRPTSSMPRRPAD
jgi:cyclic-di-GMP phosphodiesterase TipF (flagellum assembly factor)